LDINDGRRVLSLPVNIPLLGLQPLFHPGDNLADFNDEMILLGNPLFHHLQNLVNVVHLPAQFRKGNQNDYEIDYDRKKHERVKNHHKKPLLLIFHCHPQDDGLMDFRINGLMDYWL
jgi:hypothetical protein